MNKSTTLDKLFKAALSDGEDKLLIDYGPLEKVKQKLKEDEFFDGRITMKSLLHFKKLRFSLVFVLTFIILGGVIGVGATSLLKADKIDYPFVDDPLVMGKWQSVDFVEFVSEFVPGEKQWHGDLYLKEFAFTKYGKMLVSFNAGNEALVDTQLTWTKGIVVNPNEKTASKYEITDIDGSTYMFFEWKSGDYTIRGQQPYLYVLKKVDSNDYSDYKCQLRVDKIDYPFVDDTDVIGEWESVDFVGTIDVFDPERKNWVSDLFLTELKFEKDGKLTFSCTSGSNSNINTWTKGLVLNSADKTASAYTIKEINGSTYMFFEWKSGDYTMRGMDPYYYVLKKK